MNSSRPSRPFTIPATRPHSAEQRELVCVDPSVAVRQPAVLDLANGYLPPAPVLQSSEFLLPLDEETLQLYRRMLQAM